MAGELENVPISAWPASNSALSVCMHAADMACMLSVYMCDVSTCCKHRVWFSQAAPAVVFDEEVGLCNMWLKKSRCSM